MGNGGSKVNIFEYRDYRVFLSDWHRQAKEGRGAYSFRALAKKGGFKSTNFLMLVIQGKRNLTEDSLKKVMLALSLNKQEQDFFRNLVFFNQAKTNEDKNYYYKLLLQSRKFSQLKPIERKQFEYYSHWYHPVVRELVVSKDFDGTPESIARRIRPDVSAAQVSKSIELLESLMMIQKVGDKKWKQSSPIVTTGPALTSAVVHNYHKLLLDLSKNVMDKITVEHRDASALTLGVKKERIAELRNKIRLFRKEILKMVSEDAEPEEVVQLNIQFYPVTDMLK